MILEKLLNIRPTFLLGEKYRLDISWDKAIYDQPGVCRLIGAKFTGPVLNFAEKIQPNDQMLIDFYKQYYVQAKNVYIATFKWGTVNYKGNNIVLLDDCFLIHSTELNRVPVLKSSDTIVVDTKGHDRETHSYFLTYNAYVLSKDNQVYNFIDK